MLADPGRWDRYPYASRLRDPRPSDRRYLYDTDYDQYRKETYTYADRWVRASERRAHASALASLSPNLELRLCGFPVSSWCRGHCQRGRTSPDPCVGL